MLIVLRLVLGALGGIEIGGFLPRKDSGDLAQVVDSIDGTGAAPHQKP